jgi:hypothetical protein
MRERKRKKRKKKNLHSILPRQEKTVEESIPCPAARVAVVHLLLLWRHAAGDDPIVTRGSRIQAARHSCWA